MSWNMHPLFVSNTDVSKICCFYLFTISPWGHFTQQPSSKFTAVMSWYEILGIFQFTSQAAHLLHHNEEYEWLLVLIFRLFMTTPVKLKLNYGVRAVMIMLLLYILLCFKGKLWGRKDCFTLVKIASKLGKLFPWQRLTDIYKAKLENRMIYSLWHAANCSTWEC